MSTIYATRRGFLYQDMFAVLCFLEHLLAKNIRELYVDFPFDTSNQRSMDIRLLYAESEGSIEEVYGIKTGESFKRDQATEDATQIKNAFEELRVYEGSTRTPSPHLQMILLVSPPMKDRIAQCWTQLKQTEGKHVYRGEAKNAADWLHGYLAIPGLTTARDSFNFLKNVKITDSYSDTPTSRAVTTSPMEDMIIRNIQKLASALAAEATEHELPTHLLMYQLIHCCQKHAGTGENVVPILTDIMLNFFTQRRMINRDGTRDFRSTLEDTKRNFETWQQSMPAIVVPVQASPTATTPTEGEIVT